MSIGLMTEIWRDDVIECKAELLLMLALADFADDEGRCWPSISTLAQKTRTNPRNVQRMMERLKAKGWVTVELNSGLAGSNFYTLAPRHQRHPRQNATPRHQRQGGAASAPPIPPALAPYKPSVEPSENHQIIEMEDESDTIEDSEEPPQDEAPTPPPADGARRTPRMPPPRPIALESPRTGREENQPPSAKKRGKASSTRQSGGNQAVLVDPEEVLAAWNEMATKIGLARCLVVNPPRRKRIANLSKDRFWVENWRAAIEWMPNMGWIVEKKYKCDFEWFLKYDSVTRLAEARTETMATAQPPPTTGRSSKCPHPPGSPEWEKWYLANG